MTTVTIVFISSFLAILFMIARKVVEIKVGQTHFFSKLFVKGDERIHKIAAFFIYKYNRYKKISNIFVFEFLPSYLYEILVKSKDYVSKKYYTAGDGFRGRRILRSNGSVSFFLERLASERKVEKKF
ncbi:MAG: hypothetical protein V4690_00185 [Patescibacteria group bacterium]